MTATNHQPSQNTSYFKWSMGCSSLLLFSMVVGVFLLVGFTFLGLLLEGQSNSGKGWKAQEIDPKTGLFQASTKAQSTGSVIVELPITGALVPVGQEGFSPHKLRNALSFIEEKYSEDLKGLILTINSPGGGVTASDIMLKELQDFRQRKNIKVLALFQDVAASGGYYIAMGSDQIMAHPTTVTGSIGVIMQTPNFSEALDHIGVKFYTIKSLNSQGKESFKDIASPYRPMKESEKKILQELVTSMWNQFVDVVAKGRKPLDREQAAKLADGRVFTAPKALELKLIDSIGYRQDAYTEICKLAGSQPEQLRWVTLSEEGSMFSLLSSEAQEIKKDLKTMSSLEKFLLRNKEPILYLWLGGS